MVRMIAFIVAAAALLIIGWLAFWSVFHALILAFWVVLVVLLGIGVFRVRRWSRRSS